MDKNYISKSLRKERVHRSSLIFVNTGPQRLDPRSERTPDYGTTQEPLVPRRQNETVTFRTPNLCPWDPVVTRECRRGWGQNVVTDQMFSSVREGTYVRDVPPKSTGTELIVSVLRLQDLHSTGRGSWAGPRSVSPEPRTSTRLEGARGPVPVVSVLRPQDLHSTGRDPWAGPRLRPEEETPREVPSTTDYGNFNPRVFHLHGSDGSPLVELLPPAPGESLHPTRKPREPKKRRQGRSHHLLHEVPVGPVQTTLFLGWWGGSSTSCRFLRR